MLHFRKMDIEDLQYIYSDDYLKPLLTVDPVGDKFGVLIDEDGIMRGGLTGYTDGRGAMIQMIRVPEGPQQSQLKEGLLRAAIYMLDKDNINYVFFKGKMEDIFISVGFSIYDKSNISLSEEIGQLITNDLEEQFAFLDVEDFFNQPCG
ncbi:MAG: hypothetical protein GX375_00580 [Clostridiales bacterium]|nr:hypothetical protein [Clostridiales bacterium]